MFEEKNYNLLLSSVKKGYEDRIEAERKAEEERVAKEKADREERERMIAENARLQKEAEARAAAELKAKQEAEKKAAAAPDKEKLLSFVAGLSMPAMDLKTAYGQATEKVIREKFDGFKEWAKKEINKSENTLNL